MTTALATKPIRILRVDDDGQVYAVPETQVIDFTYKVEDIVNSEWGSDEWHEAKRELEEAYGNCKKE